MGRVKLNVLFTSPQRTDASLGTLLLLNSGISIDVIAYMLTPSKALISYAYVDEKSLQSICRELVAFLEK